MADLTIIVPSRSRPAAAAELVETFKRTCVADTEMVIAIDSDDPSGAEYVRLRDRYRVAVDVVDAPSTMVRTLNRAASWKLADRDRPRRAIGFMGDDHRPRTVGWDLHYLECLQRLGTGMVYGNDGFQGPNIPTQIAMTVDIVEALGFLAPPELTHLFVDNFWRDLGRLAECIEYMPDVEVEHMHPVAEKAEWDEGHLRVNTPEMYARDAAAYQRFVETGQMRRALDAVRALRGAA